MSIRVQLIGLFALAMWVGVARGFSGAGDGTPSSPYVITNVSELQEMQDDLSAHYILGNDIDASGTSTLNDGAGFEPVGEYFGNSFTGSLDGQGYAIAVFFINRPSEDYVALLGFIEDATVQNVALDIANVTGQNVVGGLVGYNNRGLIANCTATGTVSGRADVGGLVGLNIRGNISDCHTETRVSGNASGIGGLSGHNLGGNVVDCWASGDVSGSANVGGLVGETDSTSILDNCFATGDVTASDRVGGLVGFHKNENSSIGNCFATGVVNGTGDYIGGLVGWNFNNAIISTSFATGAVSGESHVGGLVGSNRGPVSNCYAGGDVTGLNTVGGLVGDIDAGGGMVAYSYSTGIVTGIDDVGGLVGYNYLSEVVSSYWDTESSGQPTSDGGIGRTTSEMYQRETFENWDISRIWWIDEGNDYPRFYWEEGSPPQPTIQNERSDIDGNGVVDSLDLMILLADWKKVTTGG